MVIEPNEDQRANFELRGTAMSLEAEVARLRAENERLRQERNQFAAWAACGEEWLAGRISTNHMEETFREMANRMEGA